MEKLQKALSKARRDRGGASAGTPRRRTPKTLSPAAPALIRPFPPVWDELQPIEPNPDTLTAHRVITLNAQAEANPFDILRTKIFLLMRQNGWTRLGITSPDKGCGKTTISCNLAVGFSRQQEVRSMLFDLDFRRPGIASIFEHRPEHDVRALLTGEVSAAEQMVRLRTNVAISMSKNPVSDPTQILLSQKAVSVMDDIQKEFEPDIMIYDLPPMLVTDDARAVLKNVDCALIISRAEHTKVSQLDVCEREVAEHTNVLGVVLNSCRHLESTEEYYGDYA
ncbi:CpsD/CapB family tyrosine-protein kinase [uncultured Roseobacter sp.]|uniref:tyrosine-protein kinase family protein n=1 Tax=uncultured Roseobacter sp. TaxID=114847 RepID=UPI00262DBCEA|nr:CpsD/CapB family tyrosine-protein kinase [uncultured Roseobacter sp.]